MITALAEGPPGRSAHSQSYPSVQSNASDPPKKPWDFRPEILATIAVSGPIELSAIRERAGLKHATATALLESLKCLIRAGLIDAWPQTDVAEIDGVRCRRDFTLYCLRRGGGEP
jgi:hypothetical protein